jgi:hypothetical protein
MERAIKAETALKAIRAECEQAIFGGWRHKIAAIVDTVLK